MIFPGSKSTYSTKESGSVFLVIFGALAMLGILGAGLTVFIKGPMTTAVKLTRANTAQTQMAIAAQSSVMAAANLGAAGDCDGDGYIEPLEWRIDATKPIPTGGNLLPSNIGAPTTDPWGTDYGYCVWDHGPVLLNASCQQTTPGTNGRLQGYNGKQHPVVAIISAGPDKTFATTCRNFSSGATRADQNNNGILGDTGDFELVSKDSTASDDLIFTYTYEEATGASGGLWVLKSSDPTTATIQKSIEVPEAKFTGTSLLTSIGALPGAAADCTGLGTARYNDSTTGHCYYKMAATVAWSTAKASCEASSAYLATVTSPYENNVIKTNLGPVSSWLGGTDATTEGAWLWGTGPEATTQFWQGAAIGVPVSNSYTNWAASQPDDGGNSDCMVMLSNGTWDDAACGSTSMNYICEKSSADMAVQMQNGVRLADQSAMPSCNTTNTGVLRRNASSAIEMCDGTSWKAQGASSSIDDLSDGIADYVKNNLFAGSSVGNLTTTGQFNTAVGTSIMPSLTSGSGNTGMGSQALKHLTSGNYNTVVGGNALAAATTATTSTAIGYGACANVTTSSDNTCIGINAAGNNAVDNVTAIGIAPMQASTGNTFSTAVGNRGLNGNTTGSYNTALGYQSLYINTTGSNNTAIGYNILSANTTGSDNTAAGYQALVLEKVGSGFTAAGAFALQSQVSAAAANVGEGQTAIGSAVLNSQNYTGTSSNTTAVGYQAINAMTSSINDTVIGGSALPVMTTGNDNTAIGKDTLKNKTGSQYNVAIGSGAAATGLTSQIQTVMVGAGANVAENSAVGIGYQAFNTNSGGGGNTGVGYQTLKTVSTVSSHNTAIGYQVLPTITTFSSDNTAIGYQALYAPTTGTASCTAAGYQALTFTTGGSNTGAGNQAMYNNSTGANNTAAGFQVLYTNTTGSDNTAMGYRALYSNTASLNTAIGYLALNVNTTGTRNTAVGYEALLNNLSSNDNTAFGWHSLYSMGTGANYNTAFGYKTSAGGATSSRTVSLGAFANTNVTTNYGTAIGYYAAAKNSAGSASTSVGAGATGVTVGAAHVVALGYKALGFSTNNQGGIAIGAFALANNTTSSVTNTAIGHKALFSATSATQETAIGASSGNSSNYINSTSIGYSARATGTNAIRLGNTGVTLIEGQVAFTAVSDARLKKDIQPTDLGLDFIMGLKPVSYRLKQGNGRLDYGFLAQDVEKSLDGREANMISRIDDAMKTYQLRGTDLLAPLAKAIQERQAKIEDLKHQIEELKNGKGEICQDGAR